MGKKEDEKLIFCSSSSIKAGPLFVVSTLKILLIIISFLFLIYISANKREKEEEESRVFKVSQYLLGARRDSFEKKKKNK